MKNSIQDELLRRLLDIIKILIIAIIVAWSIKEFVIFKAYVPTGSMKPTIMEKDQIIITKIFKEINRGDILVFNHKISKDPLIKRVIGLPGDKVEVKNGVLFINGVLYKEDYIKYNEVVNKTFIVPENSYLFFGDNRADSEDARKWSNPYVMKKDIEGKALFRIYPFNRMGKLE